MSAPFEAVTSQEAAALVADNPYSILHVEHAEIDLPEITAPGSPEALEQASQTFQTFQDHEILVSENQHCVYLHRQKVREEAQIGIVLTCAIQDYERGVIRNASTAEDAEQVRRIEAIGAQTTPVLLTYPHSPDLEALVAEVIKMPALYDFTTVDGVAHTVWRLPGLVLGDFFVRAFEQVLFAEVTSGHALAASMCRIGQERREQNPEHTGEEAYNRFLCAFYPEGKEGEFAPQRLAGLFVHSIR